MTGAKTRRAQPLREYNEKRRFGETSEPKGRRSGSAGHRYAIQKHDATRLHYDLRLELDGVLKSWAITRGPSLDPSEKRLAVRTEDHPLDYAGFEGTIPEGSYGAGTVLLWDTGTWTPKGDPHEGLESGKLEFELKGERLKGFWALVRFRGKEDKRENWLLIKQDDDAADRSGDVTDDFTVSVSSGRSMDTIAST
jgi:bifunctional non-homologous end joining protein LigD